MGRHVGSHRVVLKSLAQLCDSGDIDDVVGLPVGAAGESLDGRLEHPDLAAARDPHRGGQVEDDLIGHLGVHGDVLADGADHATQHRRVRQHLGGGHLQGERLEEGPLAQGAVEVAVEKLVPLPREQERFAVEEVRGVLILRFGRDLVGRGANRLKSPRLKIGGVLQSTCPLVRPGESSIGIEPLLILQLSLNPN